MIKTKFFRYYKLSILLLLVSSVLYLYSCSIKSLRVISQAEIKDLKDEQIIDFQKSLGLIVVPVKIEGHNYRFIFDTGAQTTIIAKHLAEKLNLKREGSLPVRDSHHSTEKLNVGIVRSIKIKDLKYANVGVVVNDFSRNLQFSCLNIDGIIGMNMIQPNNWKIDYEKSQITVLDSRKNIKEATGTPLKFKIKRGTPRVKLYVNGEQKEFLLDIGKNGTALSVSPRMGTGDFNNKLIGYSSFGMYGETDFDTVKYAKVELSDGAHFYEEGVIVSQASKSNYVIGTGYLEKYYQSITLDFKKNMIYLHHRQDKMSRILSYPFSAMLLPDAVVVGSKESDYKELNVGDTILAVNGLPYANNGCELLDEIRNSRIREQDVLSIKVSRNQSVNELLIPIQPILKKE